LINLIIIKDELSIQKKGGTDFMSRKKGNKLSWEWTAMDTVSVWNRATWYKLKCLCEKSSNDEVLPMGWGAAHALTNDKSSFKYSSHKSSNQKAFYAQGHQGNLKEWKHWGNDQKDQGSWRNSWASGNAHRLDSDNNLSNIKGLRSFYDLKHNKKKIRVLVWLHYLIKN